MSMGINVLPDGKLMIDAAGLFSLRATAVLIHAAAFQTVGMLKKINEVWMENGRLQIDWRIKPNKDERDQLKASFKKIIGGGRDPVWHYMNEERI